MGMYTAPAMDDATTVITVRSEWPRNELVAYGDKLSTTTPRRLLTRVMNQMLRSLAVDMDFYRRYLQHQEDVDGALGPGQRDGLNFLNTRLDILSWLFVLHSRIFREAWRSLLVISPDLEGDRIVDRRSLGLANDAMDFIEDSHCSQQEQ